MQNAFFLSTVFYVSKKRRAAARPFRRKRKHPSSFLFIKIEHCFSIRFALQKLFQHFRSINRHYLKGMPVVVSGDLRIENRAMLPDKFPFLCSDFLLDLRAPAGGHVVQNIKGDYMTFPAGFLQNAIFAVAARFDSYIMLRNSPKHIRAFPNVNNPIIYLNAVDSRMIVFRCKPYSYHPLSHIVFVIIC